MAFDLGGAFASVTQSAADAAAAQVAAQAKGAYGTSLDVKAVQGPPAPAVGNNANVPVQTLNVGQPGFLSKYWKWIALAGAVLALVVVMGRRKRK